jgi:hypothetical protein
MRVNMKSILLLGLALLLAGCYPTVAAPTVLAPTAAPTIEVTNTPIIIVVTSTPGPETSAAAATTTLVPSNTSITVDSIQDLGGGRAIVNWTPTGDFPAGFVIVWSTTNQQPTYPNDSFNYAGDPASRSAMITTDMNKIVYLRVCRLVSNTCDVYSNLEIFALQKIATATPVYHSGGGTGGSLTATVTPIYSAYNSAGTAVSSSTGITITKIESAGTGKAKMTWTANGTFSSGFRIFYSTSYAYPYLGGYSYYVVSSSTARSAYVDGTPGSTYYYRICSISGTDCGIYSNSYSFLYPGTAPTATPTNVPTSTSTATPTTTSTITSTATPTFTPTVTSTSTPTFTPTTTSTPTVTATPSQTATPTETATAAVP